MELGLKPGVFDSRVHDERLGGDWASAVGAPQSSRGGHQTLEPILYDCG